MAQTSYDWVTPKGFAGQLFDLSPKTVDSRINETGSTLKPGLAAVVGTTAGKQVKLANATTDVFEGVVLNGGTLEMDRSGDIVNPANGAVSVLRHGRCYVKVYKADGETYAYGDAVYVSMASGHKGEFSKTSTNNLAVTGAKFIGVPDSNGIAPIEIA